MKRGTLLAAALLGSLGALAAPPAAPAPRARIDYGDPPRVKAEKVKGDPQFHRMTRNKRKALAKKAKKGKARG